MMRRLFRSGCLVWLAASAVWGLLMAAPEDLIRSPLPHTAYLLVRRKITLATGIAMRRLRVGLKRALRSRPRGAQEA